jgi:hypothetical protein
LFGYLFHFGFLIFIAGVNLAPDRIGTVAGIVNQIDDTYYIFGTNSFVGFGLCVRGRGGGIIINCFKC